MMLRQAFKEWAVICSALASGTQSLILRKGGIAERDGEFKPEFARFWLYPTYEHQKAESLTPTSADLLATTAATRPPYDVIHLTHFAEVTKVAYVLEVPKALALADLHIWSEAAIRQRFSYRHPGLYVMNVRVYCVEKPHEIAVAPWYEGCKTWVELSEALATEPARPILGDAEYAAYVQECATRLAGGS